MDLEGYIRFAVALVFVLGLIGLAALLAKRFGMTPRVTKGDTRSAASGKRLSITEVAPVDGKRRLILVRRDDVEHLILLSHSTELVIERGIAATGGAEVATDRSVSEQVGPRPASQLERLRGKVIGR